MLRPCSDDGASDCALRPKRGYEEYEKRSLCLRAGERSFSAVSVLCLILVARGQSHLWEETAETRILPEVTFDLNILYKRPQPPSSDSSTERSRTPCNTTSFIHAVSTLRHAIMYSVHAKGRAVPGTRTFLDSLTAGLSSHRQSNMEIYPTERHGS